MISVLRYISLRYIDLRDAHGDALLSRRRVCGARRRTNRRFGARRVSRVRPAALTAARPRTHTDEQLNTALAIDVAFNIHQ